MAETTARRVAEYILFTAHERSIEMTNLKLQKLLYYCQAWYLAFLGKPLFGERIEAWIHGPVVPPVFGSFKEHRWNVIPFHGPEPEIEDGDPGRAIKDHIRDVLNA
jgi:uncharacterized phage-associated protein